MKAKMKSSHTTKMLSKRQIRARKCRLKEGSNQRSQSKVLLRLFYTRACSHTRT